MGRGKNSASVYIHRSWVERRLSKSGTGIFGADMERCGYCKKQFACRRYKWKFSGGKIWIHCRRIGGRGISCGRRSCDCFLWWCKGRKSGSGAANAYGGMCLRRGVYLRSEYSGKLLCHQLWRQRFHFINYIRWGEQQQAFLQI